ncbi:MAG: hypothetical protein ABSC17_02935 [Thermacetogeniaceae bacterium]
MFEQLEKYNGNKIAVELVNGKQITGTVVAVDQQIIRLETDGGICAILISAIQVIWENRSLTEENTKYIAYKLGTAAEKKPTNPIQPCYQAYAQPCTQMYAQPCYQPFSFVPPADPCFERFGHPCFERFGQPCFERFGQPCFERFGQPCFERFGQPCFERFGHPCFERFGHPCFERFGQPCFERFGQPCFERFGQPCFERFLLGSQTPQESGQAPGSDAEKIPEPDKGTKD